MAGEAELPARAGAAVPDVRPRRRAQSPWDDVGSRSPTIAKKSVGIHPANKCSTVIYGC